MRNRMIFERVFLYYKTYTLTHAPVGHPLSLKGEGVGGEGLFVICITE